MAETYKQKHPHMGKYTKAYNILMAEQRKEQSDKIRQQYPDRIPIICEKAASSKLPDIDKNK